MIRAQQDEYPQVDEAWDRSDIATRTRRSVEEKAVPTRAQQLKRLASGEEFDVLVVGGGATGVDGIGPWGGLGLKHPETNMGSG